MSKSMEVPIAPDTFESVVHSVVVHASLAVTYERWNKVEDYPSFMEGVREIRWLDEKRFNLQSEFGGSLFESVCEVVLRIPERRIAWRTLSGPDSSGVVCFERSKDGHTEVTLKMRFNPADGWEQVDEVRARLTRNLNRFKTLVEQGASR
jgi:uncharacterized membrane protein